MDFFLSKYSVIFTEFTVLIEAKLRSILSNPVNITPHLLNKVSITVLLYKCTQKIMFPTALESCQ